MNQIDKFFDCYIDLQTQTFNQIVLEWGKSSVTLKRWLNTYHPEILNNKDYSRKAGLNADIFLPYRNNGLWTGSDAISRLKLAAKAEVVIIFSNSELTETEQQVIYKTECLRLWTRINSLVTPFSFEQFKSLLDDCYTEVINNWDDEVEMLQKKQESFKPRRKQTLYHYTVNDFDNIYPFMTLRQAYEDWLEYKFPYLLKRYKDEKLRAFKVEAMQNKWSAELKETKFKNLKADLELIKIKEPNKLAFRKLLDRYNIQYKQKQHQLAK